MAYLLDDDDATTTPAVTSRGKSMVNMYEYMYICICWNSHIVTLQFTAFEAIRCILAACRASPCYLCNACTHLSPPQNDPYGIYYALHHHSLSSVHKRASRFSFSYFFILFDIACALYFIFSHFARSPLCPRTLCLYSTRISVYHKCVIFFAMTT